MIFFSKTGNARLVYAGNDPLEKKKRNGAGDVTHLGEYLPGVHIVLGLSPSRASVGCSSTCLYSAQGGRDSSGLCSAI